MNVIASAHRTAKTIRRYAPAAGASRLLPAQITAYRPSFGQLVPFTAA